MMEVEVGDDIVDQTLWPMGKIGQFIMDSSGHLVIFLTMIKCSVSPTAKKQAKISP